MTQNPLFATYARADLKFVRGEGAWLTTEDNRRFLDFAAGVAVNSLGHTHPHLTATLKDQADKLWHVSNLYENPLQQKLAERLCAATFADKVFFTNSGAESMECVIKTARRYHYANGQPDRYEILTFDGAFHGRTIATIAAGGQEKYLEGFGPKAPGFTMLAKPDIELVKAAMSDKVAGILLEPLQGEGGIREIDPSFLKALRALCDETGTLLLLDEVQTGVGRTGKLFAHEWAGITPDVMGVAKGIGGGFPFGACLATEKVAEAMIAGTHGSTYGGNALAMAVGNAVLDVVLEDGFLEKVRSNGLNLKQKLAALADTYPDQIETIRGEGLMLGIKCKNTPTELLAKAREHGFLAVPAGDNVLRLLPPLTIGQEEIEFAISALNAALADLQDAQTAS
ncbi:aspartate aminotransferase family protein [Cohaesibacter gelatinilyticus]|uniref:Acetylornithine aminotransferase n=1 Tax=Cohaesibacter gelatinilyticus TaxID=372072 RepID=A0A285PHF6_9HYPH|nr:aspartate aminotransferase family protein [Cohaesibacter gelatinilyticus]SNZ20677.1 acetylornithine/N-succinyldiaminopimelate aminotransferase [Cohaesibacter gelatinilyticus]